MSNHADVIVVGAGISGLCAAHQVTRHQGPESVLVLEASTTAGGYARTIIDNGIMWDWGPNGFLDREPLMLRWVDQLGLSDRLIRANEAAARRFILKNDRLVEIQPPPRFLLTSLLSLKGRARLMCEPFIRAKRDDDPESIWDFASRRIGKEAADLLVSAMVLGVFGGDAKKLSLKHCFPRMHEMETRYGGLVKAMLAKKREGKGGGPSGPGGTLTSFDRGVGTLGDAAADLLSERIRFNQKVTSIERREAGYSLTTKSQQRYTCRALIVATPPDAASSLIQAISPAMSGALGRIEAANIAVVGSAYSRSQIKGSVDGFGFLVPPNQNKRILGCIWTSSVFPHTSPDDLVVLRTMVGGYNDPEAVDLDDDAFVELLKRELHPVMQISGEPQHLNIFRHRQAIPQYLENHQEMLDILDAGEADLPNFALAGAGYRGVSLNDCVVSAYRAVERIQSTEIPAD